MYKKRIGMYSSWFGYKLKTEEQMKLIKDAGFDSVCFWWGSEGFNGPKEHQVDSAISNNLYIDNIHMPYVWAEREISTNPTYKYASCNDFWVNNEDGEYVLKRTLECLSECADYEIPIAVAHITIGHNPHPANDTGIDRIKRIIDLAERKDVIFAIENTQNPEYVEKVFEALESDKLKFCYDSGHDRIWGNRFAELVEKYSDKLVTTHLHDNHGYNDDHLIPGDGNMDFEKLKKAFINANYQGDLMFEIIAESEKAKTESVEEYLYRAYEAVIKIFEDHL